eukprot:Blabericola_migrator_1__11608@NODE_697_length_6827_cov_16_681361_g506_i0_p5_GENE_NODE_697_length_6827_cov_16_681361_g506_i0NODE_697_length_6827_cov_16_681361_g506_i0_p5_ORF_typecomplete_len119_score10_52NPFF/PF15085_6/0_22_NODE_697_length_6827_cov_16_681361_g506_i030633419
MLHIFKHFLEEIWCHRDIRRKQGLLIIHQCQPLGHPSGYMLAHKVVQRPQRFVRTVANSRQSVGEPLESDHVNEAANKIWSCFPSVVRESQLSEVEPESLERSAKALHQDYQLVWMFC